ncbi:MAG TPA: tetratricopeptide repeat protein [Thermoanaerobaculia bacterium]|nr:tetratricopeptide repeat protein [Thermoanaerobaculia bacterium]
MILLLVAVLAQTRIASDFEIAQMEKQLAQSRSFEAQLSGRLNLGDLRTSRSELSLARAEYMKAYDLAARERLDARRASSLGRYANATSYAALAQAKLGREARAFELLEESMRYASDDAESWNLYASAMRVLGHPRKAVNAARNAVALAEKPLDVAIYQHALATALFELGEPKEAERLLVTVTESLRSSKFDALKREAARTESFEIYSSARGDVAAYVSLLNRAQLRLAVLYEQRGDAASARRQYERVLEGRTDDATALAALARLSPSDEKYAEAFEANPFSLSLVREYQRYLQTHHPPVPAEITVRRALIQRSRGETRAARETLDALLAKFPENETLRTLRREAESSSVVLPSPTPAGAELRALLENFERVTPEQRVALDQTTFTSAVVFDAANVANNQTTFESGTIDGVPFRFSEPTIFAGTFPVNARLTYRILGVSRDALLLEPLGVQP